MNTTEKQVNELQVGDFTMELDDEKMQKLAKMCDEADQMLEDLNDGLEVLIRMTDYADLEEEIFPLLRTICDVKSDYRTLISLDVRRKEVGNGEE